MSKIVFPENIGVTNYGTVRLGKSFIADGNDKTSKARIRIQTHAHKDHTDKWIKNIRPGRALVTSKPTLAILSLEYPHVNINSNIHTLSNSEKILSKDLIQERFLQGRTIEDAEITLFDANHMVGSSQVFIKNHDTGLSVLYSGDIGWPLEVIPNADVLVLDATYSRIKTDENKEWERKDAISKILTLISSNLATQPIYIYARYGVMQEIVEKIIENIDTEINFVASDDIIKKTEIIAKFKSSTPINFKKEEDKYELKNVVHLKEFHKKQNESLTGLNITITNFRSQNSSPDRVIDNDYQNVVIALTNHASGDEISNYVESVNPKYVITDSFRNSTNAEVLADEITKKFKIPAIPSTLSSVWKD